MHTFAIRYFMLLGCALIHAGTISNGDQNVLSIVKLLNGKIPIVRCAAGYYQDKSNKTLCHQCLPGQYQPASGKSSCVKCGRGTYSSATGATDAATCAECPAGTYQNQKGQSFCALCPAGTYQNSTAQTMCTNCSAGTYQDATAQIMCTNCPAGTYQNDTGKAICNDCEPGSCSAIGDAACGNHPYQKMYTSYQRVVSDNCKSYPSGTAGSASCVANALGFLTNDGRTFNHDAMTKDFENLPFVTSCDPKLPELTQTTLWTWHGSFDYPGMDKSLSTYFNCVTKAMEQNCKQPSTNVIAFHPF